MQNPSASPEHAKALAKALAAIRLHGQISQRDWPIGDVSPQDLGLLVEAERILRPENMELHDLARLQGQAEFICPGTVVALYDYVDSTNTQMSALAHQQSIANHLFVAECQSAGRGRRGRRWVGGFGQNIAMTVGYRCRTGLSELGGLSSVVGLALIQVFEQFGIAAQIKWPNDIWVQDRKLAGILVELAQGDDGVSAIVGIGVNVALSQAHEASIDQQVISLKALGCTASRDELVLEIYRVLSENLGLFDEQGFSVFVPAFNAVHRLHNQPVVLMQGENRREGTVRGLDANGGLLFEAAGNVETVVGGEVSVRPTF